MKRTAGVLIGAAILLMAFYTLITIVQILFGWTETSFEEIALPLIIIFGYFIYLVIQKSKNQNIQLFKPIIKHKSEAKKEEISRYIITASENICSSLASRLKNYSEVINTYENEGNWYTNGETGPQWFTVTVEAKWKDKTRIEKIVEEELKGLNASVVNKFWG